MVGCEVIKSIVQESCQNGIGPNAHGGGKIKYGHDHDIQKILGFSRNCKSNKVILSFLSVRNLDVSGIYG